MAAKRKTEPDDRLIGIEEFAAMTGRAKATIHTEACRGTLPIPIVRIDRRLRFRLSDVLAFIDSRIDEPKAGAAS